MSMVREEYPVTRILVELERDNLLPAILFRTARRQCDADLTALNRFRRGAFGPSQQAAVENAIEEIIEKYSFEREIITSHPHYEIITKFGAGAHHAGQLLVWRLLLEELMSKGVLRLLIATGTVAAGVDFPARTVVITSHSKRGSDGFKVLLASEFQQMSGRAGRRGKDAVGFCLIAPGPYADARIIHQIAKSPPEPLRSAYFAAPATMLNLLKHRNVDDLSFTVSRSLAAFLDRKEAQKFRIAAEEEETKVFEGMRAEDAKRHEKRARRLVREAEDLEQKQVRQLEESLDALRALGYVESGTLTEKGIWAAEMCTGLVLEIAQAIDAGIFEETSVEFLVAMIASLAGDPHRPYFSLQKNPIPRSSYENLKKIVARVKSVYRNPVTQEVEVLPDAALTVLMWMESEDWKNFGSYLRLGSVAEGDVARLVTQTADHLNQISHLTKSHPVLAAVAEEGRRRLLRPPLSDSFAVTEAPSEALLDE